MPRNEGNQSLATDLGVKNRGERLTPKGLRNAGTFEALRLGVGFQNSTPSLNPACILYVLVGTGFRFIALGTDSLHEAGYNRLKYEVVIGPMPPFGTIIKTGDDLGKIVAFIRSVNPDSLKTADERYVITPYLAE